MAIGHERRKKHLRAKRLAPRKNNIWVDPEPPKKTKPAITPEPKVFKEPVKKVKPKPKPKVFKEPVRKAKSKPKPKSKKKSG